MSRTGRLKLAYLATIVCLGGGVAWLIHALRLHPWQIALLALLLLVPGRVQGAFWREFFRGRRLLADDDPRGAIDHFQRFLSQLRERPWLEHLIWLSWGTYTLGNTEQSTRLFERARELGFTGATSDQLVGLAGELLARVEGHGARRSA